MKRILSLFLLFNGITMQSTHALTLGKAANGTWQVVKIGTGLCLIAGGAVIAIGPCACAVGCVKANCDNLCNCLSECILGEEADKECKDCGKSLCKIGSFCCALTGLIVGSSTATCGGLIVQDGYKKFTKLMNEKKKKSIHVIEKQIN